MNFWNISVLTLTFLAPAAALMLAAVGGGKRSGMELRACILLFGITLLTAAGGVAWFEHPVRMEFLWPLTLEQSGYFEFTLQLSWTRYVWIFFAAANLLGLVAYDGNKEEYRAGPLIFLTGTFFALILAFLSENILLSLFFAEIAAFTAHIFELKSSNESERAAYLKRSFFVFLGLAALLGVAISHQLTSTSVMLLGGVLYLAAILVSRHGPEKWSQMPIFLIGLAAALFLMDRVLADEISSELWIPLSGIFAIGTVVFASLSLIAPATLGASFWLICSCLGYLLYIRFSSTKPTDPFWGAFEAIGLGAAYAIGNFMRFGEKLDLVWKRILAFLLLALLLAVVSGGLPTVEITTVRFDSETSLLRIVLFCLLTFFVSVVSGRGLSSALSKEATTGRQLMILIFGPSLLVLLTQVGMLLRWNELNPEGFSSGGYAAFFAEPRSLLALAAVGLGVICGGLLGTNQAFSVWSRRRDPRMENFFPAVDPSLVRSGEGLLRWPEAAMDWLSANLTMGTRTAAGALEAADRGILGERLFRGFTESCGSLSDLVRKIHTGQARTYLFLGVLVTLLASAAFLWEGR